MVAQVVLLTLGIGVLCLLGFEPGQRLVEHLAPQYYSGNTAALPVCAGDGSQGFLKR
ncbi:hypothetical protein D3C84_1155100 [compost metagenome]